MLGALTVQPAQQYEARPGLYVADALLPMVLLLTPSTQFRTHTYVMAQNRQSTGRGFVLI